MSDFQGSREEMLKITEDMIAVGEEGDQIVVAVQKGGQRIESAMPPEEAWDVARVMMQKSARMIDRKLKEERKK